MQLMKKIENRIKTDTDCGKHLEEVFEERDLGVIMQSDLKYSKQCLKAVSTANKVLGMIKRTFN